MYRAVLGSSIALAGWLVFAPESARAQEVVVDASVRVSPHLVIGVQYGHPNVVPVHVHRAPRRRVVRRIVDLRELERAHRHWHAHAGYARHHLHHDLAHGYVSPREHARWHRRMVHAHQDLHHELDHRHDRAHKRGRGRGR